MIQYQFFPRSQGITPQIREIINCFEVVNDKIDSEKFNLKSNEVLNQLEKHLITYNFKVETSKAKDDKIDVPVLFGLNNQIDKSF